MVQTLDRDNKLGALEVEGDLLVQLQHVLAKAELERLAQLVAVHVDRTLRLVLRPQMLSEQKSRERP